MKRYRSSLKLLFVLILLLSIALAGCSYANIVSVGPVNSTTSPRSNIIFVTVTPQPQAALAEPSVANTTPIEQTESLPYFAEANELGKVMVLEYHRVGYPEQRFQRTPENFRADLQRLHESGYYPVNFIDMVKGFPNLPPQKKPVVLTFDDSDISQFRLLSDNIIDADSALGMMMNFNEQHPETWPLRATFFVLGDDTGRHVSIFGQPKWAKAKVQFLVDLGMEVGSHTVNHVDLSVATAERIEWELAVSKHVIEQMAPGYTVQTLSVPYGGFPYSLDFLKTGNWGEFSYNYVGNVAAWGGPSISPHDLAFESFRVPRLEVTATSLDHWLTHFQQNPHEYYSSDGDPGRVTHPEPEVAAGE